jgi:hypothetical protein
VDFDCKKYNVKSRYYKKVVTSICNLIQPCDDDKPLTPNVDIAIVGIFLAMVLYLHFGPFNAICT